MSTTDREVALKEQVSTVTVLQSHEWQTQRIRGVASLYRNCVSATRALRMNKMRSLLTSLGIIIGVGAVIVMIAISEGSAATINQRLSTLSPNELIIRPGNASSSGVSLGGGSQQTLTTSDVNAILSQVPFVTAASPVQGASGQVVFQSQNWSTTVQGVYPSFQQINNWQVQEGSFFTTSDENAGQAVTVIGQTVADNLFTTQGVDPVGQQIRIGNVPFTVVGVLASKGASGVSNADDVVYIPYTTAHQRLVGGQFASGIYVQVNSTNNVDAAQTAIQQVLEQQHHISNSAQDDFIIQNQNQILQTAQGISQSLTLLLVGVAAVSLVVGGIGIMNIMLVSVTERTREIGIRIAVGARPRDVMTQFLVEAIMLSAVGGVIGILIGIAGSVIMSLTTSLPFVLNPLAILLAFGFAAMVGIVFGFYPAQRAARLDPIVALRTE